jgi:hypothetical protein
MGVLKSEAMELSEDEAALRVAQAAERFCPGDRKAQVHNVAYAAGWFGVGVTLKALAIITRRQRREGQEAATASSDTHAAAG